MRTSWVARVGTAMVAYAGLWGYGAIGGARFDPATLALVVAATAATVWLCADLGAVTSAAEWTPVRRVVRAPRGADHRVARLVDALADSDELPQVHRAVVRVVDDVLEAHHGVRRTSEPERAADLVGTRVLRFLDDPPLDSPIRYRRELPGVLSTVESL